MHKILLVDDDRELTSLLKELLEMEGFNVVVAYDGEQALNLLDNSIELLLLDIMMPIMDGFEVLSRLKASPSTRDIPVIIISANNDLQSIVKGIKQGAEDYLPKPFEPVLLQARIDAGLIKKRFRDQEIEYLRQVEQLTNAASAIGQGTN